MINFSYCEIPGIYTVIINTKIKTVSYILLYFCVQPKTRESYECQLDFDFVGQPSGLLCFVRD